MPPLLVAAAGLVALIAGSLLSGDGSGQYIVVAPPWQDKAALTDLIWRAGGGVAAYGGLPSLAIAMSDDAEFADRLRAEGAWLVAPSPRFLGCTTTDTKAKP